MSRSRPFCQGVAFYARSLRPVSSLVLSRGSLPIPQASLGRAPSRRSSRPSLAQEHGGGGAKMVDRHCVEMRWRHYLAAAGVLPLFGPYRLTNFPAMGQRRGISTATLQCQPPASALPFETSDLLRLIKIRALKGGMHSAGIVALIKI